MIEEIAIVSQVKDYQVWVQTTQTSSCGKCNQSSSCSTSILDKFIRKRDIVVDTDLALTIGDKVLVGINEQELLKGSLLLYIVPLVALFLGGLFGQLLAPRITVLPSDLVVAVFSIIFFIASLLVLNILQRSMLIQYFARPIVIRKL